MNLKITKINKSKFCSEFDFAYSVNINSNKILEHYILPYGGGDLTNYIIPETEAKKLMQETLNDEIFKQYFDIKVETSLYKTRLSDPSKFTEPYQKEMYDKIHTVSPLDLFNYNEFKKEYIKSRKGLISRMIGNRVDPVRSLPKYDLVKFYVPQNSYETGFLVRDKDLTGVSIQDDIKQVGELNDGKPVRYIRVPSVLELK